MSRTAQEYGFKDEQIPYVYVTKEAPVLNEDNEPTGEVAEQDVRVDLPWKPVICSRCDGRGKHSIRFGSFSGQRLEEAQADEEFWEDYTSGAFDEVCDVCHGVRLVPSVDTESPDYTEELRKLWEEHLEQESYERAERRAEMRMMGEYDVY